MSTGAVVMLVFGCVMLFGGFAISLAIAMRAEARNRRDADRPDE